MPTSYNYYNVDLRAIGVLQLTDAKAIFLYIMILSLQ